MGLRIKKLFAPYQELIYKSNLKIYNLFNFNILQEIVVQYSTKLSRVLQYKGI